MIHTKLRTGLYGFTGRCTTYSTGLHVHVPLSPCPEGLGSPQLSGGAQPPSDVPECWLLVVLLNHSVL